MIPGMGDKKVKEYGQPVIDLVKRFLQRHPDLAKSAATTTGPTNNDQAYVFIFIFKNDT